MLDCQKRLSLCRQAGRLNFKKELATRDVIDLYYFAKNNWDISADALMAITGKTVKEQISACLAVIEKINPARLWPA